MSKSYVTKVIGMKLVIYEFIFFDKLSKMKWNVHRIHEIFPQNFRKLLQNTSTGGTGMNLNYDC